MPSCACEHFESCLFPSVPGRSDRIKIAGCPTAARAKNARVEFSIAALSWLTAIGLIAAIVADVLR